MGDYSGRTVDLLFMQGAGTGSRSLITPSLAWEDGGRVTTGIQKAAQFFLLLLLTEKGSAIHTPNFGTRFMTMLRSSNMTDSRLQIAFRDAAEDILDQQVSYRSDTIEDDEFLVGADLVSFAVPAADHIQLTVQLTTRAGERRQVIMPVSLAVR